MEKTLPDGRVQVGGLRLDEIKLNVNVSLHLATVESQGFTVKLADVGEYVSASLAKTPTAICSLLSDLMSSATSMSVDSTADFPSSGVLHLGTEAILYSGKTATTFTGLTRGA